MRDGDVVGVVAGVAGVGGRISGGSLALAGGVDADALAPGQVGETGAPSGEFAPLCC